VLDVLCVLADRFLVWLSIAPAPERSALVRRRDSCCSRASAGVGE